MAKNVNYDPNRDRSEEIRKAKGNPNKNLHAKKAGSNYGGYRAAEEKARKEKEGKTAVKLPLWMNLTLAGLFVLLTVALILGNTVLKNNAWMIHSTSILLGGVCAFLFYTRRWRVQREPERNTGFYKFIQLVLCVVAVIYVALGFMGLTAILG